MSERVTREQVRRIVDFKRPIDRLAAVVFCVPAGFLTAATEREASPTALFVLAGLTTLGAMILGWALIDGFRKINAYYQPLIDGLQQQIDEMEDA